jgi:hypothetical protein
MYFNCSFVFLQLINSLKKTSCLIYCFMGHQELEKQALYWLVPNSYIHQTKLIQWYVYFYIKYLRAVHRCVWHHGMCNLFCFNFKIVELTVTLDWKCCFLIIRQTEIGRAEWGNEFSLNFRSAPFLPPQSFTFQHAESSHIMLLNNFCIWFCIAKWWRKQF